jgi:hypothetical protein
MIRESVCSATWILRTLHQQTNVLDVNVSRYDKPQDMAKVAMPTLNDLPYHSAAS